MSTIDSKIEELFKVVQKKKEEIAKAERPNYLTNCSFGYDKNSSQRINIQVLADPTEFVSILAFLIEKESSYKIAAKELGVDSKFTWMGFSVEDWKTDLTTRLNKVQISKKKKELEELEERLNKLVSPEKRAEMELAAITKMLEG